MRRKAKLVVLGTAAAALAVLLLAAIAGKDWFLEEWHLFQLEHGSREDVLAAAGWLGQKKCARAARPLLRAMRRASEEWIDAVSDSARVAVFVIGPSGITSESSPETLPPPYQHLELLRAFNRISDPATPDLIRALIEEEDELTHRLAATILLRILGGFDSFGVWVHQRDYGLKDVLPRLERVSNDARFDPGVRRLAAEAVEKHSHR